MKKQKRIAGAQESLHEGVERAFGVLFSRWNILVEPCVFHARSTCTKALEVLIILKPTIVELKCGGYEGKIFGKTEIRVGSGLVIENAGNDQRFKWNNGEKLQEKAAVSNKEWANEI